MLINFCKHICAIWILTISIYIFHVLIVLFDYWDKLVPTNLLRQNVFDYIIVGAGTAGTTLLTGFSRNTSVLIIEAGSSTIPYIMDIPAFAPMFHQTIYDWEYRTIPQLSACKAMINSECSFTLGKGYGGSNILNNLIYYRGQPNDYRGWFSDSEKYNYTEEIEPLFLKNEEIFKPIPINYISKFGEELSKISTIDRIKFTIPLVMQKNGQRNTPGIISKEYFINLPQVQWLTNSLVTKIIFEKSPFRAIGVNYEKSNEFHSVFARKGVILSAGTIGTPKLLLHSGIGPCNELESLGIDCIQNLPKVGKNLQDHITTGMDLIKINESLHLTPVDLLNLSNLYQYFNPFSIRKGPLSTVGCEVLGFLDNGQKIGFMIMPVGITVDYGLKLRYVLNLKDTIWNDYFKKLIDIHTITILPILLHPKSHGEIKLKDSNPKTPPIIDPKYLSHEDDIETLVDGINWLKEILKTKEMKIFNGHFHNMSFPHCENYNFDSKEYWKCYIRYMTLSVYHPVGTCRMGNDELSVVERDFQVKNIKNLYVVDASIMPNLPSGNPNAAVAMLARKFIEIYGNI